jgi:ankyrin repeat protein
VGVKDKHQRIALHYACQGGHQEVVRVLVGELKSRTDTKDKLGSTPRQIALLNGHSNIVKYLSEASGEGSEEVSFFFMAV